jgi:hypothetical protein
VDPAAVLNALIGSGPVAVVLFFWVWQERKERRELQAQLIKALEAQAKVSESVRMALKARGPHRRYADEEGAE